MRVVSVTEAMALEIGEKIPSLKAKIEKVYDQSNGTNDHGNWTIQSVNVIDPANPKSKIKIKFFDQPAILKSAEGSVIYIESEQGEKGLRGIEVAKDSYKWKQGDPIKKLIEVRKYATVTVGEGQRQQTPAQKSQAPANNPPGESAPASAPKQPTKTSEHSAVEQFEKYQRAVKDGMKAAGRRINGFEIAMRAVDHLCERRQKAGRAVTPEQFQGMVTSIFISMERSGIVDTLPHGELDKYLPKEPAKE